MTQEFASQKTYIYFNNAAVTQRISRQMAAHFAKEVEYEEGLRQLISFSASSLGNKDLKRRDEKIKLLENFHTSFDTASAQKPPGSIFLQIFKLMYLPESFQEAFAKNGVRLNACNVRNPNVQAACKAEHDFYMQIIGYCNIGIGLKEKSLLLRGELEVFEETKDYVLKLQERKRQQYPDMNPSYK